jgi:peptide/nickel transport system substrate-binding protein
MAAAEQAAFEVPLRTAQRRGGTGFVMLVCAIWAGACSESGKREKPARSDAPAPTRLTLRIEAEPAHLVNMLRPEIWSHRVSDHNILESLIRIDPRKRDFVPELASSWSVTDGGRTYRFRLRRGVKWHDGQPFRAEDVKFTFERLLDERINAEASRASLKPMLSSYSLIGDDLFEVRLRYPSIYFLQAIANISVLPAHLMSKGDLNQHPLLRRPVGTGPYRFFDWQSGQAIVLRRFDQYWGNKGKVDFLVYRIIQDESLALNMALRREIHFLPHIRPAQWVHRVARSRPLLANYRPVSHLVPAVFFVTLNQANSFFADRRVRLALAHLLDRQRIVDQLLHGFARAMESMIYFEDPDHDPSVRAPRFSPTEARRALEEAQVIDRDRDGIRERGGRPFRFDFLLPSSSSAAMSWLTLYQEELRKEGIVMRIVTLDWSVFLQRLAARSFDAGALGMKIEGPHTDVYLQVHSSQAKTGQNYAGYRNATVDKLLDAIRSEVSGTRRRKLSARLQRILAHDVVVIPLFASRQPGLIAKEVGGVYESGSWYQLRDFWLEHPGAKP